MFDKSYGALVSVEIDTETKYSLGEFHRAVQSTADQLNDLQYRFAQRLPESASLIFTAHLMILKDLRFAGEMEKLIENGVTPPVAIKKVAEHYVELYSSSAHAHIREKAYDVQDLAGRILRNLEHHVEEDPFLSQNRIVIAPELYPSDVLKLAGEDIKGIILVSGGITAHVSILARSLQIPMIIATEPDLLHLPEGTPIIMDAENGSICIQPSDELIDEFESAKQVKFESETSAEQLSPFTLTKDGTKIRLLANINLLSDLRLARKFKAEGVGLYRTEFPFLIRSALPSEQEQYLIYKRLFDEMDGKDVTIRTLDLGGDKLLAYSDTKGETNPDLGLRAIRFSFRHRDIFHQQIRAILRAGAEAENVRIMFPLISSLDEFGEAKEAVFDAINELENKKLPHHQHPLIGALLEIPSVVEIIDELAAAADFLSIGTNDFIQYTLAVDRSNEEVAAYYCPYHPSVLRGLSKIAQAAERQNKDLSICGEMAHQMEYIPFLVGIGLRILSVHPKFLPSVQKAINGFTIDDANLYTTRLLSETTLKGIRKILKSFNKDEYFQ
jgi:phosphotransferase system enzyme I (PtsP)